VEIKVGHIQSSSESTTVAKGCFAQRETHNDDLAKLCPPVVAINGNLMCSSKVLFIVTHLLTHCIQPVLWAPYPCSTR
jgi:hypothetical protein